MSRWDWQRCPTWSRRDRFGGPSGSLATKTSAAGGVIMRRHPLRHCRDPGVHAGARLAVSLRGSARGDRSRQAITLAAWDRRVRVGTLGPARRTTGKGPRAGERAPASPSWSQDRDLLLRRTSFRKEPRLTVRSKALQPLQRSVAIPVLSTRSSRRELGRSRVSFTPTRLDA